MPPSISIPISSPISSSSSSSTSPSPSSSSPPIALLPSPPLPPLILEPATLPPSPPFFRRFFPPAPFTTDVVILLSTEGEREYWRGEPPTDSASGENALRRLEGLRFLVGAPECEDMLPRLRLPGTLSCGICGGEAMVATEIRVSCSVCGVTVMRVVVKTVDLTMERHWGSRDGRQANGAATTSAFPARKARPGSISSSTLERWLMAPLLLLSVCALDFHHVNHDISRRSAINTNSKQHLHLLHFTPYSRITKE